MIIVMMVFSGWMHLTLSNNTHIFTFAESLMRSKDGHRQASRENGQVLQQKVYPQEQILMLVLIGILNMR